MTISIRNFFLFTALASFGFLAIPAHAQILDGSINAAGEGLIEITPDVISGDASVDADVSAQTGIVDSSTQGSVDVMIDAGEKESDQTDTEANAQSSERFSITVRGSGESVDPVASASVTTHESLRTYANAVVYNNTAVSGISAENNGNVRVQFTQPVKLFGVINTRMKNTAQVAFTSANKAEVRVKKAWWGFLSSAQEKRSDLETKLSESVNARIQARAQLDAQTQAQAIDAIQADAKAMSQTSAEASL